jgi:hypothetical protein
MASPVRARRLAVADDHDMRGQLARIRRVADMLCSAHAGLRDRYALWALLLDLSILFTTSWLVAMAFIEPRIDVSLTPFRLDPKLWTGLLAVLTLFFAIIQTRVDWKGRSDAHRRSLEIYSEVKREAGYVLSSDLLGAEAYQRVVARNDLANAVAIPIPELLFLQQKKRHLTKVTLSRQLDKYPGASVLLLRLMLWWNDNFRRGRDAS